MKPIRLAVAVAVLAAAALLFFALNPDTGARSTQRSGTRVDRDGGAIGSGGVPPGDGLTGNRSKSALRAGDGAFSLKVAILMPDGAPAAGAEVKLSGRAALTVSANAKGHLDVTGLDAGFYALAARKGRAVGALSFELDSIRDLGTLTLANGVTIRGKVFGQGGKPLAGALVEAAKDRMREKRDMMSKVLVMIEPAHVAGSATSAEDGSYELFVPTAERLFLRASATGHALQAEPSRVFLSDIEGFDFHLSPSAELTGKVVNEAGAPIPGANVLVMNIMGMVTGRDEKAETMTDQSGRFRLALTPVEQSLLVVRATGYASYYANSPDIKPGGLTIELTRGFLLRLRAVDENGRPAPDVSVMVVYRASLATGKTRSDGRLEIANVSRQTGPMGNQQQIFLHGGIYVPKIHKIEKEPENGLLDLGDVELSLGGTVRGQVLDAETKQPVKGAMVRAIGQGEAAMMASSTTKSGEDGAYELNGVPLTGSQLIAFHPDYASAALIEMMMRSGTGTPLFDAGRREARRDLLLIPAVVVEGIVVSPDNQPVAGAQVIPADEQLFLGAMLGLASEPPITDAEGRFSLRGMKKGAEVPLTAVHRDYGPSRSVTAKAGGGSVKLTLASPVTLEGKVVNARGRPVVGATVTVEEQSKAKQRNFMSGMSLGATRPGLTDAKGHYVVRNAIVGDVVVQADHSDYKVGAIRITVAPGKGMNLPDIVVEAGLEISGTVVDEQGEPLVGVHVFGYSSDPTKGNGAEQGRRAAAATTDAKGTFRLKGLSDGTYSLSASGSGWRQASRNTRAGSDGLRFVLKRPAKLTGTVTSGGQPVIGATVSANRVDQVATATAGQPAGQPRFNQVDSATTGADGSFALDDLPPGETFTLRVTHNGYREKTIRNVMAAARPRHITLETGGRVAGRVVDGAGKPLHGAQIEVFVDGREVKTVQTDSKGRFEAGGLDEGEIALRVEESGLGLIATPKIPVRTGDRGVHITAQRGESISGRIKDQAGKPVRYVAITAIDEAGNEAASTWSWAQDGSFKLQGLPRGSYRLKLRRQNTNEKEPTYVEGVVAGTSDLEITIE